MKRMMIVIAAFSGVLSHSALSKVTIDDGYASEAEYYESVKQNRAEYEKDLYDGLEPPQSGSGSVVSKDGTCQAPNQGSTVCTLADTSYSCFMSGGAAIGESEFGQIYRSGNHWKMSVSRGKWGGVFYWTCTKPS
ncbi:hypothetical protein AB4391_01270 [Vibrio lentus]|uniref:Uncharacterized protein n=1 Tax=Vibrio lentus TaxID=136468 RepID=A0A2N7KP40_9VIBR|nr:hypothetical protein [Vibrio lentus]PMM78456.1 hypothetical protein BCT49_00155 [Vibrio lentus]